MLTTTVMIVSDAFWSVYFIGTYLGLLDNDGVDIPVNYRLVTSPVILVMFAKTFYGLRWMFRGRRLPALGTYYAFSSTYYFSYYFT